MSNESTTFGIRVGPVLIDVPRSIGYFGGVGAAVALGMVDPPLAAFIAAVPFFTMLTHRSLPVPVRVVGEALEGAAKPVGGDDDGYVQLEDEQREDERARAVAAKVRRGDAVDHPDAASRRVGAVRTPSTDERV
ncbi:hypothetical protein [Actinomycetospora sp. TBRC 11914]|uniref:hypothetical protein n=1 Tax=Actinomycetospora sp. TBRC 11914 TaxID=2729387 RepID=UPI00145EABEF|nr:hypothetical protein [Actinomycetospora sp. TBRC 11914]NMO88329.1 hypothetical protein [Actinomycetospora sp. TBRC 11914]